MKTTINIDNIPEIERNYFKTQVFNICANFKITFNKDKASVIYYMPYNFNEYDISKKSRALKAFRAFLDSFRIYQFNNERIIK